MYIVCGENHSWVEGRITRLPLLPSGSQLFLHFYFPTKLSGPFTWQTKSWLSSGVVNRLEWLWNLSDSFVICFFWTCRCTTFNSIPNILILLINKHVPLIYSLTICQQKTKDCAPSDPSRCTILCPASNIDCSTVTGVFIFDVCCLS